MAENLLGFGFARAKDFPALTFMYIRYVATFFPHVLRIVYCVCEDVQCEQ